MFKDYYAILEISFPSDEKEIKAAYRKQSLKWHPDRNPGKNTEEEMKSVNEAYTILSKPDLKRKYDAEYTVFRKQKRANQNITYTRNTERTYNKQWEYAYDVKDENLKNDINNARKSSEEYVKAFMASLKTDAKSAAKGALKGAMPYIISGVILLVFTLFVQMCS